MCAEEQWGGKIWIIKCIGAGNFLPLLVFLDIMEKIANVGDINDPQIK